MHGRKRNKHKTLVQGNIKRRLMEISIRFDNYIYKNIPITVEEAEKYLQEIRGHRTQCNNDMHILQVIEKLTKYMKYIIEETTENVPSLRSSYSEYSVNNKDKKKGDSNFRATTEEENILVSRINNPKFSTENVIVISHSKDEKKDNSDNVKSPTCNDDINDLSTKGYITNLNVNEKNNEVKSCNFNIHHATAENSTEINSASDLLIATRPTTMKTHILHSKNTKGKKTNHLNPNQDCYSNITHKTKKKITKRITNTRETLMTSTSQTNTKNIKKINNLSETQKPFPHCQTLNLEATINTKTSKKKNKCRLPKNNDNDLQQARKRRKKSTKKKNETALNNFKDHNNIPSTSLITPLHYGIPNKYTHTQTDTISDEVALPVLKAKDNTLKNIAMNQDIISEQMGALKLYNDRVLNDLSWIEDIRYVRQISSDEYDKTPNIYNEIFWDNFSLPDGWNEVNFLD